MTIRRRQLAHKFFADRGTHLAAMVAYFALLSFVPLVFLALSLLGLAHRAEASDFFIKELKHAFPGTSLNSIIKLVRRVQDNAAALGIIGGIGLVWSSLSFFSALESALNIVYGLPNRRFLRGKLLAALLDLKPTHTVADLCQNVARIDRVMFERSLARHSSGVHLLASPLQFTDIPLVTAEGVRKTVGMAKLMFPYIVIDLDHSYHAEQVEALVALYLEIEVVDGQYLW